jgi:hypothetical protein
MGDAASRRAVLQALGSADEREVQLAQAYLRHRPIDDARELRTLAEEIARMPASASQVRALDAIARQHVSDTLTLQALAALYVRTPSPAVQRAVAEVFLRSDRSSLDAGMAQTLLRHRLKRDELIDQLLAAMAGSAGT